LGSKRNFCTFASNAQAPACAKPPARYTQADEKEVCPLKDQKVYPEKISRKLCRCKKNAALLKVYPEKFVHFERNATFVVVYSYNLGQRINI